MGDFAPVSLPPVLAKIKGQKGAAPAPTQDGIPTAPKARELPAWAKALAALSTLSGGPGAQIANTYLQAGDAKDQAAYQQGLQDWARQRQQGQQAFDNGQATARTQGALVDRLSGLDAPTQQNYVNALLASPQDAQAYGHTPQTLRTQFFDAQGAFQPVNSQADARDAAATQRAQATARAGLYGLTPEGQQAIHDSYAGHADEWGTAFGTPFEAFTPAQTQRDVTAAQAQQQKATGALSTEQQRFTTSFFKLSPAVQSMMHNGMDAQEWQRKTGLSYQGFKPGMTQADALRQVAITNRETDARRRDTTQNRAIDVTHGDRQEGFGVTERGQDLAHGDRLSQ